MCEECGYTTGHAKGCWVTMTPEQQEEWNIHWASVWSQR